LLIDVCVKRIQGAFGITPIQAQQSMKGGEQTEGLDTRKLERFWIRMANSIKSSSIGTTFGGQTWR
jgi:hypothetical protein